MAPHPDPQGTGNPETGIPRPSQVNAPTRMTHMVWPWILIALAALGLVAYGTWYVHARLRARRLGLPPPSLYPFRKRANRIGTSRSSHRGGVVDWVQNKFSFGGKGGYTGTGVRRGRGGFGALDPDEAWDSRVGTEADGYGYGQTYGEEQELGVTSNGAGDAHKSKGYGPVGGLADIEPQDGREERRAKKDLEDRYAEEMNGGRGGQAGRVQNPFEDGAERSDLRSFSPRPTRAEVESPTERKSLFKENV